MTKELTSENFNEVVLNAKTPVLVDFYFETCDPCKLIIPKLNELSTEYEGRVLVTKIDTEMNRDLTVNYGVKSAPTLLFFFNGKVVETTKGYHPTNTKREIKIILDKMLEESMNPVF